MTLDSEPDQMRMSPNAPDQSGATVKLRVAFCHPDLGIGGAERLVVDAASELASRGHEVVIFTAHHDGNRCFPETVDGSFSVSVFGDFLPRHLFGRLHALCAYLRCLALAFSLLLRVWLGSLPPFDVVVVDQVSAVIPVLRLMGRRTKILFYCHFPDMLLAQRASLLRQLYRAPIDWLEESTTGMADVILVNSEFTASIFASTFASLHARGIRPAVLYPAVALPALDVPKTKRRTSTTGGAGGAPHDDDGDGDDDRQLGLPCGSSPFFLSINRFERKKAISVAIAAFSLLQRHLAGRVAAAAADGEVAEAAVGAAMPGATPATVEAASRKSSAITAASASLAATAAPASSLATASSAADVHLIVAGGCDARVRENTEYLAELRSLAAQEGVSSKIHFLTSVSDKLKARLLASCLAVVYTPSGEHFGIVPVEAMAASKPVIACNDGGPRESVADGRTGLLCAQTPSAFAAAMAALLYDPHRAELMGEAARRHVEEKFSRHKFGDELEGIITAMCRE